MKDVEITRLIEAMSLLRKDYADMTLTQAIIFLRFGQEEGLTGDQCAAKTDVTTATISRVLDKLGKPSKGQYAGKGLDYLKSSLNAEDYRRKTWTLTKRGTEVRNKLIEILKGAATWQSGSEGGLSKSM